MRERERQSQSKDRYRESIKKELPLNVSQTPDKKTEPEKSTSAPTFMWAENRSVRKYSLRHLRTHAHTHRGTHHTPHAHT